MPSVTQYQTALIACLNAEPPRDYCLSDDASHLASVYAEMVANKEQNRELNVLKPMQREAYKRWSKAV